MKNMGVDRRQIYFRPVSTNPQTWKLLLLLLPWSGL